MAIMTDPVVEVTQGKLKGIKQGRLLVFRGVPYAQADRFKPPRPFPQWSGVRSATEPGPICPQFPARLEFVMGHRSRGASSRKPVRSFRSSRPESLGNVR